MIPDLGTMFSQGYVLGAPAAVGEVLGRITELSGTCYEGEWSIIEVATPHGSTVKAGRCYVRVDLSRAELDQLGEFEEAVPRCKWLYEGKLEEHRILTFFGHVLERHQVGSCSPRWEGEVLGRRIEVDHRPTGWVAFWGWVERGIGETPASALWALEWKLRDLHGELGSLLGVA